MRVLRFKKLWPTPTECIAILASVLISLRTHTQKPCKTLQDLYSPSAFDVSIVCRHRFPRATMVMTKKRTRRGAAVRSVTEVN